jgi:Flp pilus assembly protein CpaB
MAEAGTSGLMPKGAWRTLVFAVVLGIVGIALMNFYLRSRTRKTELTSVAVAAKQIVQGDTIKHGMVVRKEIPKGMIGGRYVSGNDIVAVEGRVMGVDMDPGQPLYWNSIPLSAQGGYDRYLRPENRERAFAVSIAGAPVRPGDVIDILGTYAEGGRRTAFEVLPAVTVIDKYGSTLVLSVTPEEELLLLAATPCELNLSIRSKMEPEENMKLDPVSITDVLPRARTLGAARSARLREETRTTGTIRRDD